MTNQDFADALAKAKEAFKASDMCRDLGSPEALRIYEALQAASKAYADYSQTK